MRGLAIALAALLAFVSTYIAYELYVINHNLVEIGRLLEGYWKK